MRRGTKSTWLLVCAPLTVLFIISGSLVGDSKQGGYESAQRRDAPAHRTAASPSVFLPSVRPVTKSLAELGKMDETNSHLLFLNHVPNCGGEILILLLQRLQGFNNYKHIRLKGANRRKLTPVQQEALVDEVYDTMREAAVPVSLDRPVYFIDFQTFDKQSPTYVNLIRDPVDKVISSSTFNNKRGRKNYFIRCLKEEDYNNCNFQDGKPYDLTIPYFCGHDSRCLLLNNDWALQQAKANVERYYPVLGILEELNGTLAVLEAKIPYFFKGVQKMYGEHLLHQYHESRKRPVVKDEILAKKLRKTLHKETEFYEWAKNRLLKQIQNFNEVVVN